MTRAELEAIYRRAHYRVHLEDDLAVDLTVGARCPGLDRWLAARGAVRWGFLTAVNPGSRRLPEPENRLRLARLLTRLRASGCELRAGVGLDPAGEWPAEPSFLVVGASEAELARWAGEFDQAAFLAGATGSAPRLVFLEPGVQAPPARSV